MELKDKLNIFHILVFVLILALDMNNEKDVLKKLKNKVHPPDPYLFANQDDILTIKFM